MQARRAASIALTIASWGLRLCAIVVCLLTALLCFSGAAVEAGVAELAADLAASLPEGIAGWGLASTPFGGVFRTDFALVAIGLFAIDYLCARVADLLR